MKNRTQTAWVLLLGAVSLGSIAVWDPPAEAAPRESAPVLGAFYARAVEDVETHVLRRGETLTDLLARASITGGELANLLLALREHENPRRLTAGVEVTVRKWAADGQPRRVDLRVNADSTVRLERSPMGWAGQLVLTPTQIDTVFMGGIIRPGQTLWESVVRDETLELPPAERYGLVGQLAEVYAYTLDFTHDIKPGDAYRLVYEREARPDGTARERRILTAEFINEGRPFWAIYFNPAGDRGGYYDRDGMALRKGFLRYPVEYRRVTSNFNPRRYHPILGVYRAHNGTDYGARHGEKVVATGDGVVTHAGVDGGYGNLVSIRHAGGYTTRYAHLSRFAKEIRPGRSVEQGQVIGYVGSSGLATGPHLHYELRHKGRAIDSRTAKLPGAPPVPDSQRSAFELVMMQRLALLDLAPGTQLAASDDQAADGPQPVVRSGQRTGS